MTKELLIITLLILVIYFAYKSKLRPNLLANSAHSVQINNLQQEVQHYQTLYQKRVEKDLAADQSAQIQQLTTNCQQLANNLTSETQTKNLYRQKIGSLESQLINLAKLKLTSKKSAQELVKQLENNWQKDKDLWKNSEQDYSKKLTEIKKDQEEKERVIINLNNSYDKLSQTLNQKEINLKTYLSEQEQIIAELEKIL